jgi:trans-feruloyl-CoA hydratase/vanillin synthase
MPNGTYETVKIERDEGANAGITWVILNRPEKRNAMSPQLHFDMVDVLNELESDARTKVLVLTGAGEAWCAGQDLKLYFRELDNKPAERARASWASHYWRWQKLFTYPKPTIAMVNGFCFGGGFTQLIACDFAFAAEDAKFGLSEVNWGILPGGFVSKALTDALGLRDAVWLAMTGETFDGKMAEKIRLIHKAVPRDKLREETVALAQRLMKLNPEVLKATKIAIKNVRAVPHEQAADYLQAKSQEMRLQDKEGGRSKGMSQFLDDKSYRPGYGPYARTGEQKA